MAVTLEHQQNNMHEAYDADHLFPTTDDIEYDQPAFDYSAVEDQQAAQIHASSFNLATVKKTAAHIPAASIKGLDEPQAFERTVKTSAAPAERKRANANIIKKIDQPEVAQKTNSGVKRQFPVESFDHADQVPNFGVDDDVQGKATKRLKDSEGFDIPPYLQSVKMVNLKIDLQNLWDERSDAVKPAHGGDWSQVSDIFAAMQKSIADINQRYRDLSKDLGQLRVIKEDTLEEKKYVTELYEKAGERYANQCAEMQGQTRVVELATRGRAKSRAPSGM